MEQQEIQLGLVTYDIQRIYRGNQPIQELVMARLEREYLAHPAMVPMGRFAEGGNFTKK